MAYIGVSPSNGVRQKHTYTATASQTTFSGAGSEGVSLSYRDSNYVDVYRNGVKLGDADYTATSGTSIVLGEGAAVNDIVEIVTYDVFSVADTVSKADGGTFDGNVAMAGTLDVTGDLTVDNATLKVDSTNNRVGISTSSMTSKFEVAVSDNTAVQEAITIKGTQGGAYGGYLGWKDNWSGDSYTGYRGAIIADVPSANSGRLRFFTANSSTLSEKMRIDSSGNVGIGTSSPSAPLHINGTSSLSTEFKVGNSTWNSSTGSGMLHQYRGSDGYSELQLNSTSTSGSNVLTIRDGSGVSSSLYNDGSAYFGGNVGIGTSSPSYGISVQSATDTSASGSFKRTGGSEIRILPQGVQANIGTYTNHPLIFNTNSTERMRIDSSGDFLFLGGTIRIKDSGNTAQRGAIYGSASEFHLNAGVDNMVLTTSGGEAMRINSSGNVGIGTSSPVASSLLTLKETNAGGDGAELRLINSSTTVESATQIVFTNTTTDTADSAVIKAVRTASGQDFRFSSDGSERMRIDSSGRVAIGTTTVGESSGDDLTIATTGQTGITIRSGTANAGSIYFSDATSGVGQYSGYIYYDHNGNNLAMGTNSIERMRIASNGYVHIGGPNTSTDNSAYFEDSGILVIRRSSGSNETMLSFVNGGSGVGRISTSTTSTSYVTSSDYRLKENAVEMTDATTRLKQLQPKRFNFIADADTTVDGFLAHEVQSVVPEAITGTHNEVDANGNPVYQGIDQSKLVPLLVKTIQELEARIVALENA